MQASQNQRDGHHHRGQVVHQAAQEHELRQRIQQIPQHITEEVFVQGIRADGHQNPPRQPMARVKQPGKGLILLRVEQVIVHGEIAGSQLAAQIEAVKEGVHPDDRQKYAQEGQHHAEHQVQAE